MGFVSGSCFEADLFCVPGLCDRRCFLDECDPVCCLEEVLRDGGHDHLRVGPGNAEVARAMSDEETFHRAKALFDAEPSFGNLLVEAFLRLTQRAVASRLAHDAIAMLAFQGCPIGFTGTGFVGQHTLCSGSLDHRAKLRAFARVGRSHVNLVDIPLFVCAGKALEIQRASSSAL